MEQTASILIVDPDPDICKLLTRRLQRVGYAVTTALTAAEAMRHVRDKEFDLVVLEWMLPDVTGDELCKLIKGYDKSGYLPIIMLTAREDIRSRVQAFEIGVDDYIVKPFSPEELQARMRVLLRNRSERIEQYDAFLEMENNYGILLKALAEQQRSQSNSHAVTMRFDFPEPVKVACQQYLLYFVEFLRDIGIEATANLREDEGKVLFAVTPRDKDDALDNIRGALEIYLRLPMNRTITSIVTPETSMEIQKLSANIHHLQGQLLLASAALQQKQFLIEQQQAHIQQMNISAQVLVDALRKDDEPQDDAEPVIGSIVKVKRWNPENIPVDFDLPAIMRWMKERFRRRRLP